MIQIMQLKEKIRNNRIVRYLFYTYQNRRERIGFVSGKGFVLTNNGVKIKNGVAC